MLRFAYASQSHVGLVRENNEDSGFAGPYLQLVADGVGGEAAGEVASATTAYVMSALTAKGAGREPIALLHEAVRAAHEQLCVGVQRDPSRCGMATTLTAVLVDGDRFAMAHIGDSRAYLLRDEDLTQLTADHTFVQSLVDGGQLAREEVVHHPYRSVVLKSLDGEHAPDPDVFAVPLQVGDRLLVCSDGLTDYAEEQRVLECLRDPDRERAVSCLVGAALDGGGRDNVTCLVADVEDGPQLNRDGTLLGAIRDPHLVVDPAAVSLGEPA